MRRLLRYSGVSIVAFLLAQVGLFVAYGLVGWSIVPAVLFSMAVSAVPAYFLSRIFVWPDAGADQANVTEGSLFLVVAVVGSLVAILVTAGAEHVARGHTSHHATLTAVVNLASIVATVFVWLVRYTVLDRLVFAREQDQGCPPTATRTGPETVR